MFTLECNQSSPVLQHMCLITIKIFKKKRKEHIKEASSQGRKGEREGKEEMREKRVSSGSLDSISVI